jgi:putative spermidine/putrescine transport system substrate-binding protein
MKRRSFMISASAAAAGAVLLPKVAFADANRIDWYTSSAQNILDFWTNTVKPKFEAANPGVTLNLVDGGDNAGLQAIASRALAALDSKADPQADFFEGF